MRLDKYLKVSRLIKRRTVANEADRISIRFGEKTVTVEVLSISETAGKADAPTLYREVAGE